MTFAIHGIFEAIFRPGVVIIRPNRTTITPHYALPGLKIALKSPRSDKRQQTLDSRENFGAIRILVFAYFRSVWGYDSGHLFNSEQLSKTNQGDVSWQLPIFSVMA